MTANHTPAWKPRSSESDELRAWAGQEELIVRTQPRQLRSALGVPSIPLTVSHPTHCQVVWPTIRQTQAQHSQNLSSPNQPCGQRDGYRRDNRQGVGFLAPHSPV